MINQDEVFAIAKAAGMDEIRGVRDNGESSIYFEGWPEQVAAFAALVAAKEREACAQVCQEISKDYWMGDAQFEAATRCCNAIRARGTKDAA